MRTLGFLAFFVSLLIIAGIVVGVVVAIVRIRKKAEGGAPWSPKHVFLYLLAASTLYISAIGVLILIWGLAEYWFPDPYAGFDAGRNSGVVRGGVSMAIVAFPIFAYLSLLIRRKIHDGEIPADSTLRAGFIYFNLFVVTVVTLITLMVTVNSFLDGDLTLRFLVRAGGVLGITGLVYLYYRSELEAGSRRGEASTLEVSA